MRSEWKWRLDWKRLALSHSGRELASSSAFRSTSQRNSDPCCALEDFQAETKVMGI